MSLRSDMLRAARQARGLLGDAAGRTAEFVRGQALPDGGFRDLAGKSDLYYTVFGLQCLASLEPAADLSAEGPGPKADFSAEASAPKADVSAEGCGPKAAAAGGLLSSTRRYLRAFSDGRSLDFIHAACLARCWALAADPGVSPEQRRILLKHIEEFRSDDGGYHLAAGVAAGSAYACFMALGAYQDLEADLPDPAGLVRCLRRLRAADGGYANEAWFALSLTPATAAAVVVLAELGEPIEETTIDWLLARIHPAGGFLAAAEAPIPDLLSTATALHALARAGFSLDADSRSDCRRFVESLRTDGGGFRGHTIAGESDCEYTWYGLLALGHLSIDA